jgi:23S rRNA pseudouridine1911/1915/1917 synthase
MIKIPNPKVLFDDNYYTVVLKPAGTPVAPDKTGDANILDYLIKRRKRNLHLVHRIDRPVSGIVLIAKTNEAMSRMSQNWHDPETEKHYLAVVSKIEGLEQEGELKHVLTKGRNNKTIIKTVKEGEVVKPEELSTLDYKIVQDFDRYRLLEISLRTGRHHQIRAQMQAIGCPIKGDVKYGDKRGLADRSILLHAYKLAFVHPFTEELLEFEEKPEGEFWKPFLKE